MIDKNLFDKVSKIISILNKHMDEKFCTHDIRQIVGEVFND